MKKQSSKIVYKLLRIRKNGTLGPLFINKSQIIPIGKWLHYEDHPTKGFAHRPGWHCSNDAFAPHLSKKNRAWYVVEIRNAEEINRPISQGGKWWLAKYIKVLYKLNEHNKE